LPIRGKLRISIGVQESSNNNYIEIGENSGGNLSVHIPYESYKKGNILKIGKNSTMNGVSILLVDDSECYIGNDCMFSSGIQILTSDTHVIFDKDTREVISRQKYPLVIGNHCWIGMNVTILKNVGLADNSVVGAGATLTKKFTEENIIVAGNPAKIIKNNINWDRKRILHFETDKYSAKFS
jgi:acetyltransferase-like isoleucine patch superfamily enzyme